MNNRHSSALEQFGVLRANEPMSRHSTWRTGGIAKQFFIPTGISGLSAFLAALERDIPVLYLGLGSNLLVRDGGFPGVVICLQGGCDAFEIESDTVVQAGAGLPMARLAKLCARAGLSGCEFMAGIPGTIGGALAMNAGAQGAETWDLIRSVEVIDRSGNISRRPDSDYQPAYRSILPKRDEWFLGARLEMTPSDPDTVASNIRFCLEKRGDAQPTGQFSCGSVFRNPPGDHAGRLIEAAGLKGASVGGAMVSDKHANFIINKRNASAADIEALIYLIRENVKEKFNIELITEVHIVGNAESQIARGKA